VIVGRRVLALELVLLGLVLVAAGALFRHGLSAPASFDEAVYLLATGALRHGQALGSEIFTAQPPGFYTLIRAGQAVFGATVSGGRDTIIALALVGLVGAYLIGRTFSGWAAGLTAAALLAVAPPFPTFAANVSADLPSFALGLLALAFLLLALDGRAPLVFAAASGALLAASFSVKLSAVTLAVPVLGFLWARRAYVSRRMLAALAAGFAAVALALVVGYWGGLHGIWTGAVDYHSKARGVPGLGLSLGDNAHRVLHFLDHRTPFAWLVLLAVVIWLTPLRPRLRLPLWPLVAWAVASALFLIWHHPLHDNHMVLLAVTLAVPAGITLGAAAAQLGGRWALVAGLVVMLALGAGFAQEWRRDNRNAGAQPAQVLWAVRQIDRLTRPGELVVTDEPIVGVLAGRQSPGQLIDTAFLRFDSGLLTDQQVLDVIDRNHVRAVVAARAFRAHPKLLAELARRFPRRLVHGGLTIYLRA
jgi:4-amino-4-deoxy-L-arabinose transferase-like glycosyltransferase